MATRIRSQPVQVEVPAGTPPPLARVLENINRNLQALFADVNRVAQADPAVAKSIVVNDDGDAELDGDEEIPAASYYYGTNASSVKGWHEMPNPVGLEWDAEITKVSDESVTSSTTNQSDNELVFTTVANTLYRFQMVIIYTSGVANSDIRIRFNVAAGTFNYCLAHAHGLSTGDAGQTPVNMSAVAAADTNDPNFGTPASATLYRAIIVEGHFSATNATTFALQWAQGASQATATTVKAGSVLRYVALI